MDKMAENATMVSLIGNAKTEEGSRDKSRTADGDSFAKVLEKTTGHSEDAAQKTRDTINPDRLTDRVREKAHQRADLEERLKGKLNMKPADMSMANYLYNIVLRNPDSLSMIEKQAFRLGEFSNEWVGVKELQRMLNERGIHLRDLSMTQLAQLTQRNSKPQITAFLNDVLRQMRETSRYTIRVQDLYYALEPSQRDERERKTVEARGGELHPSDRGQPGGPDVLSTDVPHAERSEAAERQRRNEQRENVMRQIIARMEIQTVGRRTDLTLKLNPEYLGEMRVTLSTEGGRMEAAFETTSREVRQYIEEGWESLRGTFSRKGLNLARVSATLVESVS